MASLALLSLMAHAAPIPVTICPVLQTGRTGHAQHAAFGVEYWANEVPALNATVRFIGTYEAGSSTLRGVVGAFVLQSAGCDAIVGPGISDMATALNPVVNQMWVEYQASTTDFSNRINYPYFNRVNPDVSVTQSFFGQVLQRFGWTHINMFCVSTSYGRSVAGVVSAALGTDSAVYNSQCVANNIDYNTTRSLIQTMKASPSRVIFFAFSTTDPVAKNVYQVVKDLNLTQTNILLWSDSNCAGGGTAWAFPGSYCAANDVNNTRYNAFFAQYSQRGVTRYSSSIAALGFPSSQIDYNSSKGNQQAYAADAARVALHALDYYYASNTVPTSKALANAAAAVRAVRIPDGLSGDVYLPNGDRLYNTLRLYSAGSDGSILVAGEQSATGVISLESQQFAMGDWHAVDAMPYDVAPPAPAPPAYWAIGVALGGVLIIGVFAAFKLRTYLHLRARPTDGTKGFAVMFVAVKNEADVRDQGQAAAAAMLGHIRAVVKSAARRTECFEARRVDDATVMLVAKRAESAVECAAIITQKLEATNWNPMLATRNEGTTPLPSKRLRRTHSNSQSRAMPPTPTDKDTTPTSRDGTSTHARSNDGRKSRTSSTPSEPSHPLINIGIHYGFGVIDHDLDTDHVSYHGAVVTRAASVADAASQRQVLVSRAVVDAIEEAAVVMPGKFVHVDAEAKTDAAESEPSGTAANGSATSNTVFLYIPHDLSSLYEDFVLRPKTQKLEHGAIAAALATADAGLARRRVVLLSIAVPELMTLAASNRVQDISDLIADVTSLATEHRGAVLSIAGPQIVVGINCAGPVVSQAACRAAALATRLVETLGRDRVTIGIAASCAVASAGACVGSASAVAEAVRLCAAAAGVSIAAACSTFQDLDSKFQLLTIDHICLPQLTGCTRVYAVLQEIVATDEWLYAMNKSSHACINEDAWDKVIQLVGSQDDVTAVSAEIHHEIGTIHHNLNPEAGELVFSTVKASMVRLQSIADEVVSVPRPTVTPTPHYIWMRRLDALTRPWRNAE